MKFKASITTYVLILIGVFYAVGVVMAALLTRSPSFCVVGLAFYTFTSAVTALSVWFFGGVKSKIREAFFNTPIYIAAGAYFLISGFWALQFAIAGGLSVKPQLIAQIIFFAVFAVVVLITNIASAVAMKADENVEKKNEFIRTAASMTENIKCACTDSAFKRKLERLAEDFRYSKPTHDAKFTDTENSILDMLDELDAFVGREQYEDAELKLREVQNKLTRRNNGAK